MPFMQESTLEDLLKGSPSSLVTIRVSIIPPVPPSPVSVPPIRPSIISVSIRSVVIPRRVVAWTIKYRYRDRKRNSYQNSSFGLGLEKHCDTDNKRQSQKRFSHRRLSC